MLMVPAYSMGSQEGGMCCYPMETTGPNPGASMVIEALPTWQEAGELGDHREYILHYHTIACPQFMNGYCPGHRNSSSRPDSETPLQCFCYHHESQRRRPLVDALTGQLRYWDVLCEHIGEGEECPSGDLCPYAHTREEISYHAAKYKTKFCNDKDCRGEEVCCFAHNEQELREHALDRYSFWSIFGNVAASGMMACPRFRCEEDYTLAAAAGYAGAGYAGGCNGAAATGALYHPKVYRHRFCASYPHVASCRRGEACAFAHSREEIRTPLLASDEEDQRTSALTNDFFMHRFKTLWCPVGVQHDWQTCVYAHNYQDARRHPGIGYGPRPCPYWKRKETSLEYAQRCPLGVRCPFSHGAKEQLYHPSYFKTVTCQDWRSSSCPRGKLCAFWHKKSQQRSRPTSEDDFDYKLPIPEQRLEEALQADFLSPPFKLLNSLQAEVSRSEALQQSHHQQHAAAAELLGNASTGELYGEAGVQDSVLCQPWDPALCGGLGHDFNSIGNGGTAAPCSTPTTAAETEEVAESSTGSDKTPAVLVDEETVANLGGAGPTGQLLMGGDCVGNAADMVGQPWSAADALGGSGPHGGTETALWHQEFQGHSWGAMGWSAAAGECSGLHMAGFGGEVESNGCGPMLCYVQMPAGMELPQQQMQQLPSDELQQQLQQMPAGIELSQQQMQPLPSDELHQQLQQHQQQQQQEQQGLPSVDPELCGGQAYDGEPIPHSAGDESAMSSGIPQLTQDYGGEPIPHSPGEESDLPPVMPQLMQDDFALPGGALGQHASFLPMLDGSEVIFQQMNFGCGNAAFPGDGGFHGITACSDPVSFPIPTLQPLLQMGPGMGNPMQGMIMMGLCNAGTEACLAALRPDDEAVMEANTVLAGEEGKESWVQDDAMPTHNGFIHFKEASDDSDDEVFPVGRRPRANSH